MQRFRHRSFLALLPLVAAAALPSLASAAEGWWNPAWTVRKKITLNTGADGAAISSPTGVTSTLIRLHEGNYPFGTAKEDGADLRFVAEDNKTPLPYHIERWDGVLYEALVWVKTDVKPGAATSFWLYTGNQGEAARGDDAKGTWAPDVSAAFHFSENSGSPADSTAANLTAEGTIIPEPAALIGGGARFTGANQLTIPVAPQLAWAAGGSMTWTAWTRHSVLKPNSVLFSRRDGANALIIGEDNGVPYVEVATAGGKQRSSGGTPVMANTWRHLAVTATGGVFTVFLDGEQYGTLSAPLPELNSVSILGRDGPGGPADANGFAGEVDELRIHSTALTPGALKFAFLNQGPNAETAKLLTMGPDESGAAAGGGGGHSAMLEHVMLFGDIAKNMMFDGWIAVGVCCLMIAVGWTVAVRKFFYLNRTQKGDDVFLTEWKKVSSDLTALDHADKTNVKSLGGNSDEDAQEAMEDSPIYHIYHIGSEEISHRLARDGGRGLGLSARSIQAIRSSLDAGLVKEHHRLNNGLVYLTISIAGGPYVGLLGTVVGVMITFAIIAKTGEVEVNSIAPGIASALLATVAGLVVAIPALFIYSYLSNRIRDTVSNMQVFIDEFVAKMAEFYPPASEMNVTRPAHAEPETARR